MSTTIAAVIVQLLTIGLPLIGVTVGTQELTGAVQVIILVASGVWIWVQRVRVGDVSAFGVRK